MARRPLAPLFLAVALIAECGGGGGGDVASDSAASFAGPLANGATPFTREKSPSRSLRPSRGALGVIFSASREPDVWGRTLVEADSAVRIGRA